MQVVLQLMQKTELFLQKWEAQLEDINCVRNFSNLLILDVSYNRLQEVSALSEESQLIDLNIEGNKIKTIAPLDKLKNLQKLNINDNPIEIFSIKNKYSLHILLMRNTTNENLEDIQHLCNLQTLDISNNKLNNLEFLKFLINLEVIDISGNNIDKILFDKTNNKQFEQLKSLTASNNQIQDLSDFNFPNLACGWPSSILGIHAETFDRGNNFEMRFLCRELPPLKIFILVRWILSQLFVHFDTGVDTIQLYLNIIRFLILFQKQLQFTSKLAFLVITLFMTSILYMLNL
ncbi:leucine-rich_repeat domain-containing protein [Hexamita inflata]|uniref:Leucine-rich repeat domain-containing protein n=1 Tax=Hexamita inflata TaxID=28002 RepID=A0AA86PTR7_9EUKA|nr:leucine-rich repeat domain-containing protein [Hexamita inflata]